MEEQAQQEAEVLLVMKTQHLLERRGGEGKRAAETWRDVAKWRTLVSDLSVAHHRVVAGRAQDEDAQRGNAAPWW